MSLMMSHQVHVHSQSHNVILIFKQYRLNWETWVMFLMSASIHLANKESQEASTTDAVFDCFLNINNRKKTIVLIHIVNFVRFALS